MVSLPLNTHRVRFTTKVEHSFTTEEALTNLGSLKFSQSNRMPDPKDPSRIVTTTTTKQEGRAGKPARPSSFDAATPSPPSTGERGPEKTPPCRVPRQRRPP